MFVSANIRFLHHGQSIYFYNNAFRAENATGVVTKLQQKRNVCSEILVTEVAVTSKCLTGVLLAQFKTPRHL